MALASAVIVSSLALTGCSGGSGGGGDGGTGGAQGEAQHGGVLRVGHSGGASSDTMDPHEGLSNTDFARLPLIYEPLVRLDHEGNVQMWLAESIELNDDATEYTIKIHPNVKTHDGNTFTAEDVLWNFKRIVNEHHAGEIPLGPIDVDASEAVDDTTLIIRYSSPFAVLPEALASTPAYYMVPSNWSPDNLVGTGPFVLQDFEPGVRSSATRFEDYRLEGKPYLDQVDIINMADETTQLNALRSGEVDAINYLSAQSVKQVQSGDLNVIISETKGWLPITMRTDSAPFDDVRVREAIKLAIDREQINQVVFEGYGTIQNDVFDPLEDSSLPQRERDVERAKELLADAGFSDGLDVELITNDVMPAQRSIAQLVAEQIKEAGINAKVTFEPTTQFFADSYLTADFSQDYWFYVPYLANVAGATLSTAPYNATHFDDAEYESLYQAAISEADEEDRRPIIEQMQRIDYERGGNIIPVFYPVIDATTQSVGGIEEDVSGFPFGNYDWTNIWMAQ
ncbi:ABC transporter substrate-binding protein [Leucobacter sp. GX24907]